MADGVVPMDLEEEDLEDEILKGKVEELKEYVREWRKLKDWNLGERFLVQSMSWLGRES